jgi:hypothetical protein
VGDGSDDLVTRGYIGSGCDLEFRHTVAIIDSGEPGRGPGSSHIFFQARDRMEDVKVVGIR